MPDINPPTYVPARQRHWTDDKSVRIALAAFWGNLFTLLYSAASRLPDHSTPAALLGAFTLTEWINLVAWAGACVATIYYGGDSVVPPGQKP